MNINKSKDHLLLLHLSDIHFHEPYCLDKDSDTDHPVRVALLNDIEELVKGLGNVDAILISGDIAQKGHTDEYKTAKAWLADVAEKVGCPESRTFPVPGNHDVSRAVAKLRSVEGIRSTITKKIPGPERDTELQKALREDETREVLMKPMEEYNLFAAAFGCDLSRFNPFWKHELSFASGWKLMMHGLTTTLFSGEEDKERDNLYIGALQSSFSQEKGIIRLAMLHHPPEWLKDCDKVSDSLNNGCQLHLIGHRHQQRYLGTADFVRLAAGAVNPARSSAESWEPGYNLIKLQVIEEAGGVFLKVDSYQRNWQGSPDQFIARLTKDKKDVFTDRIRLYNLPSTSTISSAKSLSAAPPSAPSEPVITPEGLMDELSYRELVTKFWKLSTSNRWKITFGLELLTIEDGTVPEVKRYRQAFEKARQTGKMEELRIKIEELLDK